MITVNQEDLNAVADKILQELANHNIRISDVEKILQIVKENISQQIIVAR